MNSTREHLLGYLLGALEPAEMEAVERELEADPQLRKDLAAIEAALNPLGFPEREDDASLESPPRGLVARTCEFVDDSKDVLAPKPMPAKVAAAMSAETASSGRSVRWADVIVAGSVMLAAVALLFPAVWSSRQSAQIVACQENLRHLGMALAEFAGRSSDGRIPAVPMSGNRSTAGIYAAVLREQQLLDESFYLVCPSSDLAEQEGAFRIPSLGEIDRAEEEYLAKLHREMGGSYGFNIGYLENGELKAPKHQGRTHYVLMSDAPCTFQPVRKTSNHAGCGQNILFEDNHIEFVKEVSADLAEDPYLNRSGIVAAGLDCTDVVVAESFAKPCPLMVRLPK